MSNKNNKYKYPFTPSIICGILEIILIRTYNTIKCLSIYDTQYYNTTNIDNYKNIIEINYLQ